MPKKTCYDGAKYWWVLSAGNDDDTAMVRRRYAWSVGKRHALEVAGNEGFLPETLFRKGVSRPRLEIPLKLDRACSS